MGAALSSPCAIKLDRVDEPSPVSSYPGGGSTSSLNQKTRERSSSKTEQRVVKDNSANEAALSKKQNDFEKSPSSGKNGNSSTTPQKRPPKIVVAHSETLSTTEVDGASKVSMETTSNSPNEAKSSTSLPSSVYNVQFHQSPSNRSSKSEQVAFSEANNSIQPQQQLNPIVVQQGSNPLPIPSQTLPVRSPKNYELRSGSTEDPPTLQPLRRFQSPTNSSYENKPTFNSPSTPVNLQSPTRTPASTSRNRPHYLSKISSPPTRGNSPTSMLSSLRQSRDQKSNSDSSVYDVSSSFTLSESTELAVTPTPSSKKSLSSSSVSESHPYSLKQKSSSSASISTNVNNNVKNMKSQIEESVMKFNASIGTDSKRILPKRRHSLLASGRNSPSLLNELKQNEKSDSTCSPSTVYNPSIPIGQSNIEKIQQERRFSDFVTPLTKKRSAFNQATKPLNNSKNSRNRLRASVENPATLTPVRAPARRRMSISVSPQHKVEMTTTAQVGRDQHGRKIINQYTIIKKLGKGSYGSVKLGKNEQTGQLAAIKVINRSLLNNIKKKWSAPGQQQNNQISKIKLEIAILKNLDHPNIVRLLEVIDDPMNDKICLVFEFIDGGELMKLNDDGVLVDGKPFTEDEARYYFRQMLNSLEYLHFNRVVHRDIKPSNILLTKTRDVKLSDFGVSKLLAEDEEDTLDDSQGTPAFLPPEACYKGKIQGKPADIWALGITLYCMVVGQVPFRSDEAGASKLLYLYYVIQHEEPQIPENLSPELKDIITRMLDKNAKSRITMDDLQEHPWVTKDEESFIEEPQKTLSELYPDFSSPNIQYLESRRKSAIPTNRTYVHHAQLRKMHSTRKVVVDSEDIDNAIKEKEYDPNTPKKTSFKKEHHHNHNASIEKISLVRNRSSCKILVSQEPSKQEVRTSIPTIEINSKTE